MASKSKKNATPTPTPTPADATDTGLTAGLDVTPTDATPTPDVPPVAGLDVAPVAVAPGVSIAPPTIPDVPPVPDVAPLPDADPAEKSAYHNAVVRSIAGDIVSKVQDEGLRNLTIGAKAIRHARWQKAGFPNYTKGDYDSLMRRVRDDVRLFVPIKPESIRVDDWALAAELRDILRPIVGDAVGFLSYSELRILAPKAMTFSKSDVTGEIVYSWVETIRGIVTDRATGRPVSSDTFNERVTDTAKAIAKAAEETDPAKAATVAAGRAIETNRKAIAKANEVITSAVSDAIGAGHVSPEQVSAILETVAKAHNKPVPSSYGFDPARATVTDVDILVQTMANAGRGDLISRIYDRAGAVLAAVAKKKAEREGSGVIPMSKVG